VLNFRKVFIKKNAKTFICYLDILSYKALLVNGSGFGILSVCQQMSLKVNLFTNYIFGSTHEHNFASLYPIVVAWCSKIIWPCEALFA